MSCPFILTLQVISDGCYQVCTQNQTAFQQSGCGLERRSHEADKTKTSPKTGFCCGSAMRSGMVDDTGLEPEKERVRQSLLLPNSGICNGLLGLSRLSRTI